MIWAATSIASNGSPLVSSFIPSRLPSRYGAIWTSPGCHRRLE